MENMYEEKTGGRQVGPIVGIVIVVLVLVLGSLYFVGKEANDRANAIDASEILAEPDGALQGLQTQGTSDEIDVIEEDLNSTLLEDLDAELNSVESELEL